MREARIFAKMFAPESKGRIFKDLQVGARFRFPTSGDKTGWCIKTSARGYVYNGNQFISSGFTPVVLLEEQQ